ncbi:hypothetical protein [Labrys monachus]|uniref:Uncharacterized protein n=1 Tax=Labrys monachus TaxID=217067 RepID=A0ABU0FFK8_9HYPH|nr:hypothetical protein [Labrys monachus]MDQ0392898.1 hypothetical protein [Labrys monachus]
MEKYLNLSDPGLPPYAMQRIVARDSIGPLIARLALGKPGCEPVDAERTILAGPTLEDARHEAQLLWKGRPAGDAAEGYRIVNSDGEIVDVVIDVQA